MLRFYREEGAGSKLLGLRSIRGGGGKLGQDGGVGEATVTEGDEGVLLVVRKTATDQLEDQRIAEAGILQLDQPDAGKDRFAFRMTAGDLENHKVGDPGEAHGLELADAKAELIQASELEDAWFVHSRLSQTEDSIAGRKRLVAIARDADKLNAAVVRNPALLGLDEVGDFGIGDVELAQLLDCAEAHAGGIERSGIGEMDAVASGQPGKESEQGQQNGAGKKHRPAAGQASGRRRAHFVGAHTRDSSPQPRAPSEARRVVWRKDYGPAWRAKT